MVNERDYKSGTGLPKKPLYYDKSYSLCDIVGSELYFGFKELKDNIVESTSKGFHKTIDTIVKNKNVNIALAAGTFTSIAFNIIGSHYAHAKGEGYDGIDWTSYIFETVPHALVSLGTFLYASRREGKSWNKCIKDIAVLTAVSAPISLLPYRLARDYISNSLMMDGMPPEGATPIAQIILLIPYALSVNYSLKAVKKVTEYISDKNSKNNKSTKSS